METLETDCAPAYTEPGALHLVLGELSGGESPQDGTNYHASRGGTSCRDVPDAYRGAETLWEILVVFWVDLTPFYA